MEIPSSRLYEDLADDFRGELLIDAVALAAYACDASPHEQQPFAVAVPRDRNDIVTLLRYAAEHHLPVIPRGGGSSTQGGAIGTGIIVDCSRYLRGIGPIDDGQIRVEAGVTLDELNRHVHSHGWMFGPNPLTAATTTVGGMVAMNAAGSRTGVLGDTRAAVLAVDVVLADGTFCTLGHAPGGIASDESTAGLPPALQAEAERWVWSPSVSDDLRRPIIADWNIDWPRVFAGSAGTLGVITAATLQLQRIPAYRSAVLFAFRSLESALHTVPSLVAAGVAACDLLDRRLICLAREAHSPWRELFPVDAEAGLLVEWFASTTEERTERLNEILNAVTKCSTGAETCRVVLETQESDTLWTMPAQLMAMLSRLPGTTRPLTVFPEITVPVEQLEHTIVQVQRILQHRGLSVALHAHVATGQLHFRPLALPPQNGEAEFWRSVQSEATQLVGEVCGWADSQQRRPCHPRSFISSYPEFRRILDPHLLLNPAQFSDASGPAYRHVPESAHVHSLQLNWTPPQDLDADAVRCNGCGACRTQTPDTRMCPFFREEHDELTAPRAKANVFRQRTTLPVDADCWETATGQRLLSSCFNCKQCVAECPSGVDIPRLALEMRSQYVASHGLTRAQWYLTRIPDWMPWLRYGAVALRPILQRRWFRWLVERLTSISRHRRYPTWRTKPFLQTAPKAWRSPPSQLDDRVVVYFVDHVANWHEPEIALAAGKILEHHGFRVHVPVDQVRSGIELINCGDFDRARVLAEKNLEVFGEFARAGCRIVCTEPSAAVCLKMEYPRLLDHPDANLISQVVEDIGGFLQRLSQAGALKTDFQPLPLRAGYHQPCHQRVLNAEAPLQKLCSLIPGVVSPKIEAGCLGMAGVFGWAKETYEQSVAFGKPVATAWETVPATVALSECSSCRQQLEHLTHRRAEHPLVLLAEAYGLLPRSTRSR